MTTPRRRTRRRGTPFALLVLALVIGLLAPGAGAGTKPWYEQSNPQAKDSEVNVTGAPSTATPQGEVRGLIDAHTLSLIHI